MKTTIKRDSYGYVHLEYTNEWTGERVIRTFKAPPSSGYVREWNEHRQEWRQVFGNLSHRGWALIASQDTLLGIIRKEWSKMRRDERRQIAGEASI